MLSEKSKDLLELDADGQTWQFEFEDRTYRMREATYVEMRKARRAAMEEDSVDFETLVPAFLLEIVTTRKTASGWEPVPWTELIARGETFIPRLAKKYTAGLKAKSVNVAFLSKPSSSTTTAK